MTVSFISGVDLSRFLSIVFLFCLGPVFYIPVLMSVCLIKAIKGSKSLRDVLYRMQDNWDSFLKSGQAKDGFAGLLAVVPLLVFFCIIKSLFPVLAPDQWDEAFSLWDLKIHGAYPHDLLMPFAQNWNLQYAAEQVYIIWFLLMFLANFYCLFFDSSPMRRKQYLWSFTLCWIISGTILALAFYSSGPIFYHLIYEGASNPYENLMGWLSVAENGQPATALTGGMHLYSMANDGLHPDYNGPSAMPSQHVAIAWLLALYGFKIKPWLGCTMTLYTFAILFSSILLGWHYAVDGYAGIAVVTLIWVCAGAGLKWKAKHERIK